MEEHLGGEGHQPYLFGKHITEADIRLYTTLIRFDVAYYNIFMCNLKMIRHDYPRLSRWLRNLYWNGGKTLRGEAFKHTVNFWTVSLSVLRESLSTGLKTVQYKYGYLKSKGSSLPDDKLVIPKGPFPDIQPLDDMEVSNGH